MSYKLINANNITFNSDGFITAKNIEKMSCIYADLPNGMDGEHYVLEQQSTLDKIRAEIEFKSRIVLKDTPNDDWTVKWNECIKEVLEIIDKYRESEGLEHDSN